jgi:hypothetical protein
MVNRAWEISPKANIQGLFRIQVDLVRGHSIFLPPTASGTVSA